MHSRRHWTKHVVAFIKQRTFPYNSYHQVCPTIRELALRYGVGQQSIIDFLENQRHIHMYTGVRIGGYTYKHDHIGDYNFKWLYK